MISLITLILEALLLWYMGGAENSISTFTATMLILIASIAVFADIGRSRHHWEVRRALNIGYLWRIFFLYFDVFGRGLYLLPNSGGDSDVFYSGAVRYMQAGGATRGLFPRVMGTVFRVIGPNRLFGQYLLLLCSMVTLVLIAGMMRRLKVPEKQAGRTMLLIGLLPNVAILSSIFLRESIVCMFVTLSVYFFVIWLQKDRGLQLLLSIAAALLASSFHAGTASLLVAFVAVRLLYNKRRKDFHFRFTNVFPAVVLIVVIAFLFINYADVWFGKLANVDSLDDIANTHDAGGSSYAAYVGDSSSPLSVAIYTIPRMVYFLFSPFPWQWRGLNDIITFFFSSMFYLSVSWRTIKALRSSDLEHKSVLIAMTIVALCAVFTFGWGVSNTGTAMRHREKLVSVFALMLALTQVRKPKQTATDAEGEDRDRSGGTHYTYGFRYR